MKGLETESAGGGRDPASADAAPAADRIEKSLHALRGDLARLERKLDRLLALSVESSRRPRP